MSPAEHKNAIRAPAPIDRQHDSPQDPDAPAGRRFLGVADVLTSSTALLELGDKAGVPVGDAASWCAWAVGVLHRASKEEQR